MQIFSYAYDTTTQLFLSLRSCFVNLGKFCEKLKKLINGENE